MRDERITKLKTNVMSLAAEKKQWLANTTSLSLPQFHVPYLISSVMLEIADYIHLGTLKIP